MAFIIINVPLKNAMHLIFFNNILLAYSSPLANISHLPAQPPRLYRWRESRDTLKTTGHSLAIG